MKSLRYARSYMIVPFVGPFNIDLVVIFTLMQIELIPKMSSIRHLQTLENRAPLTDGQVTQDPHSSLDVLYICSGQHRHGTLREIRSGIGVELLSVSPSDPQWDGYAIFSFVRFEQYLRLLIVIFKKCYWHVATVNFD